MKSDSKQKQQIKNLDENPIRGSAVILKSLVLFIILNLLFASIPENKIGKVSLYNHGFPGRTRLPFGENPTEAYNFSLFNLDAMIGSHLISDGKKPDDEFRIVIIGDSSTWGILLKPEETLAGLINKEDLNCKGKEVKTYNLGYPTLSITKDLMILDRTMKYDPDLIIWSVTLESFPIDKQLSSPIVENNIAVLKGIVEKNHLQSGFSIPEVKNNFIERTIVGQRRNLADLIRLQIYGVMWAATGIDQYYPENYEHAQIDLSEEVKYHELSPDMQLERYLAFNVLDSGKRVAGNVPILLVNEPILISNGLNSDIRYNFYYPRWVYDQYRNLLDAYSNNNSWNYIDLWDIIPSREFTNSAIHLTAQGEQKLANKVITFFQKEYCHE